MRALISIIVLLLLASICYPADIVQIATTRDTTGHFNNWTVQTVTWDTTIYTDIPDSYAVSYKVLQTWAFPISEMEYLKATFTRSTLGEYAIRWSRDGVIWSDVSVGIIQRPGRPR